MEPPQNTTPLPSPKIKHRKFYFTLLGILSCIVIGLLIHEHLENIRIDNEAVTFKSDLTADFGQTAFASDFLEILNGEMLTNPEIDTYTLGDQTVTFEFRNLKNKPRTRTFTINVTDKTSPQIFGKSSITVPQGYTGDLTNLIMSADNRDDHPQRKILGTYDLDKPGTYSLTYQITDDFNNQTTQDITLSVIEPPKNSAPSTSHNSSNSELTPLEDIIDEYKTSKTTIGIDVSEWQGKINWSTAKAAGVEFAFLRIGYQPDYDAEIVLDKYFETNLKNASAADIPIGIYLYSYAKTPAEAEKQVDWIHQKVINYPITLGLAFDWENWQDFNSAGVSLHTLNQISSAFLKHANQLGYKSLHYSSKNYLDLIWRLDDSPIWLAQYYHKPTYDKDFQIWQMSDSVKVPGIDGAVDLDILYK